jgi:NAD(P)-dependent dehydrogenase (short-subunit alcohol dehydrogenase family)
MRLKDKVALVSGAASGMGRSTAEIFAREGAIVIVGDVLEAEGRKVVDGIAEGQAKAEFARLDVTDEANWKSVVDGIMARHGRLDVLVNNAGVSGSAVDDLMSTEAWDWLMGINAKGVFLGHKYAIPAMKLGGGGSVINLSSISGIVGQEGIHAGYNASKGAVRLLTKSMAAQHSKDGIRVNSVHPGLMPPMRTSGLTANPEHRAKLLETIPIRRAGRVEEVAHAILFLASDEASYVTGAELVVDGGWTAV